jgi:NADH-quinone oxidoreductase subunit F
VVGQVGIGPRLAVDRDLHVEDLDLLQQLSEDVKMGSLCGLGRSAPNPILTTLRYFREEYEVHIRDKKCPAKVCKALLTYSIDEKLCKPAAPV